MCCYIVVVQINDGNLLKASETRKFQVTGESTYITFVAKKDGLSRMGLKEAVSYLFANKKTGPRQTTNSQIRPRASRRKILPVCKIRG